MMKFDVESGCDSSNVDYVPDSSIENDSSGVVCDDTNSVDE